jgi:hypothetical protein
MRSIPGIYSDTMFSSMLEKQLTAAEQHMPVAPLPD